MSVEIKNYARSLMDLANQEIVTYVVIAVILCLIVLLIATDSYIVPIFLLLNIGIAIIYNFANPKQIKSSIIALKNIDNKLSNSQLI